jgi:acetoin utilization protein AcuB
MNKTIEIRTVMTPTPLTIGDDQLLEHAKHELAERGIRHLPVLHGGRCVGIISDRDIKLAYAVEPSRAKSMKVTDACAGEVYTVTPSEPVYSVAKTLAERGIGSAVVVENNKVVGIFAVTDACKILAQCLAPAQ